MKKSIVAVILAISGMASVSAIAAPSYIPVDFVCPTAVGAGSHVLARFPSLIAGYGEEVIDGSPAFVSPYFQYYISTSNIPAKLTSYYNNGTDYDSTSGVVSCMYASSASYDSFVTTYQMTNGVGGQIISSTPDSISIYQPVGLKA